MEKSQTNLPLQLTSFIGREREIAEVKRLLATTRLLTLTGSGGCGKTRLALQVAADLLDEFLDGVCFVDLAPLSDPTLVPQTVASIFDLRESGDMLIAEILQNYLRTKNLLLVLDNCEHLIQACAELCDALLHTCPDLKILATSREVLGIAGETAFRVPSLSLPDLQPLPPTETLAQYESIRLFVERARAARSDFQLIDANAPAVAQICHRLDGIPLAIELAAARVKALKAEEIAARLDDRFRLLRGGSRTALPRQQTLRATIDWSYDLLSEPERGLLRSLSVFAGGCTLVAAEEICASDRITKEETLDLLTRLADKSMLIVGESEEATRYNLLETLREYAREKLDESGESAMFRNRHLDFFLKLVEQAESQLKGPEEMVWFEWLERELDNLRVAFKWALKNRYADLALMLSGKLHWFWVVRGYSREASAWLESALAESKDASATARAKALLALGALIRNQGEYGRGVAVVKESLDLYRELGDKSGIAFALNLLGVLAADLGDNVKAKRLWEESLALRREVEDKWGIAQTLQNFAHQGNLEGDYAKAEALAEESLSLFNEVGDKRGVARMMTSLGATARLQGDDERATALLVEALSQLLEMGDQGSFVDALDDLALLACTRGSPERAARLFGAAETLRDAVDYPVRPTSRASYDRNVALVRAQLNEATFSKAWAEGRALTLEQALAEAEQLTTPKVSAESPQYPAGLTAREVEVLRWLALGLSNQEIADKLVLSKRTVHAHLRSIYSKLDVTTRSAATRAAIENRLVSQ